MKRETAVFAISVLGLCWAIASLILAPQFRIKWKHEKKTWGYAMLATWVLLPPVWFWFDWFYWAGKMGHDEQEHLFHMYELARNIWVALVVILAAIMEVKWPGGGAHEP